MYRLLSAICLLTAILCAPYISAHIALGPHESPYVRLEQHFLNEISKKKLIGAAVAVIDQGEITFIKSFGVRKKGEPGLVDNDTVFQVGSTSKPITASLFAIARKQKLVTFDSPVSIGKTISASTKAKHLLSHTSGFGRIGWNWQIEHGKSRNQLIELLAKRTQAQPGQTFDYHNFAYSLVEELLQKSFNLPFKAALERHLLLPLGMTRTTVGFNQFEIQTNRAWPHEFTSKGECVPSTSYSRLYHDTVVSAAGINSSISDMAKFLKLQFGQYPHLAAIGDLEPFYTPVVEAPDAKRWFKNRVQGDFSSHYGYGWRILKRGNDQLVFHGGWLKGFASVLAFSPKSRRGIVVLANSESGFAFSTAIAFFEGRL